MATSSRDARRRRIADRGSDRLALITGRIETLPSSSSSSTSPESYHSHTASCPPSLSHHHDPHLSHQHLVLDRDFVVVKMDVEGTEFHLIPRLVETGAICLIDEMFIECHYNRWQGCCPERSSKYQKTYTQCLNLFSSLRDSGVLHKRYNTTQMKNPFDRFLFCGSNRSF